MTDGTTQRDDGGVIPSGVPAGGETSRGDAPVISSGVTQSMGSDGGGTSRLAPPVSPPVTGLGIGAEPVLNGVKHKVTGVIAKSTGEAEVFLAEREGGRCVLKLYYPNFKPKDAVLKQLKGLKHPDTIELIDCGYHGERFFEVMEYAAGGSLGERTSEKEYRYLPMRDLGRVRQLVSEVVNALEFCHSRGIIHRDIKPENTFYRNADGTDIAIGDFGISSALDAGLSKHMTGKARTAAYAAPELYQSIEGKTVISKEVDYYALGITLIYIWSGANPLGELSELMTMRVKMEGRVPLPGDLPQEFRNLVLGLTTVEPSKRWGYTEVQRWLRGEPVTVHHRVIETVYRDFHFGIIDGQDLVVSTPEDLAGLLEDHPVQAKKHLYKGTIAKWLENADQFLYAEIRSIIEDDYPTEQDAGLTKAVYTLDQERPFRTSGGVRCQTSEEIGDAIEKESAHYRDELKNRGNNPLFLYLEARGFKDVADAFRKYAQAYSTERAFNLMLIDLQGRQQLSFAGRKYGTPADLLGAGRDTKADAAIQLQKPESKLSIWLEQFAELKGGIDKWRRLDRHSDATIHYALDPKAPFDFYGEKVHSVAEFDAAFARLVDGPVLQKDLSDSSSLFAAESTFWLNNYQTTSLGERVEQYLETRATTVNADTLGSVHGFLMQAIPGPDYYYSRVKRLLARIPGKVLDAARVPERERAYVVGALQAGDYPSELRTYQLLLREHLLDAEFLRRATGSDPLASHLDEGLRKCCQISYAELLLDFMRSGLPARDERTVSAMAGYLISSCKDADWYWKNVKPLVDDANRNGLIEDSIHARQEAMVGSFRSGSLDHLQQRVQKVQDALEDLQPDRYRQVSRSDTHQCLTMIAKLRRDLVSATKGWGDGSYAVIDKARRQLDAAEQQLGSIRGLLQTLETRRLNEEAMRRQMRARRSAIIGDSVKRGMSISAMSLWVVAPCSCLVGAGATKGFGGGMLWMLIAAAVTLGFGALVGLLVGLVRSLVA